MDGWPLPYQARLAPAGFMVGLGLPVTGDTTAFSLLAPAVEETLFLQF
jgi:hypothetical protein